MLDKKQETYQLIKDNVDFLYFLEEVFFVDCSLMFKIFVENFNLQKGTEKVAQDYYNKQKNSYLKDLFKRAKLTENVFNEDLIFFEIKNQTKEFTAFLTPKRQRFFKLMNYIFSKVSFSEKEFDTFKKLKENSIAFKTFEDLSQKFNRDLVLSQLVNPYKQVASAIAKNIKQNYELDYPIKFENPNETVFQYNQRLSVVSTCRAFGSLERQSYYQEYENMLDSDLIKQKNKMVNLMNELLIHILTPDFFNTSKEESKVIVDGLMLDLPKANKIKGVKI